MTEQPPITSSEVIPSPGAPAPPTPSPSRKPRGFKTWWLVKKWAWRNTAALLWLLPGYSALSGFGTALGFSFPPVTSFLPSQGGLRVLVACAVLWLLLICEFQLTQMILFGFYVASFPIWLVGFGVFHYVRNRLSPTLVLGRSPFKTRALRVTTAILLVGIFLWWPLPNSQIALSLGVFALVPGFYLFRRTLKFSLSPGVWMRGLRTGLHEAYERLKKEKTVAEKDPAKEEAARQVDAWKAILITKYESSFLGAIDRGLMRWVVVANFCFLFLASLMYLGFLATLLLRGLAGNPDVLAAALGRPHLPNLLAMAFICSLGVLGEWRIDGSMLPPAASAVVFLLNLARVGAAFILVGAFWAGYGADLKRAEQRSPPFADPGA